MGKIVEIDWEESFYLNQIHTESIKALQMNRWCTDRALVSGVDFSWYFDVNDKKLYLNF